MLGGFSLVGFFESGEIKPSQMTSLSGIQVKKERSLREK